MTQRDIIFRGIRVDNGKWVYGSYVEDLCFTGETFTGYSELYMKEVKNVIIQGNIAFEVRPETVGQYTGLKDKKGKMIFEDDIVTVLNTRFSFWGKSQFDGECITRCVVKYGSPLNTIGFYLYDKLNYNDSIKFAKGKEQHDRDLCCPRIDNIIEVIGDIHTTPEIGERE